jgi:hypothetical protein
MRCIPKGQTVAQDFYDILGVTRRATAEEITTGYKNAVKKFHPDRHQENELRELAEEKLKLINEAYAVLSDSQRRDIYDRQGSFGPFVGGGPGPVNEAKAWGKRLLGMVALAVAFPIVLKLATNPRTLIFFLLLGGGYWLLRRIRNRRR